MFPYKNIFEYGKKDPLCWIGKDFVYNDRCIHVNARIHLDTYEIIWEKGNKQWAGRIDVKNLEKLERLCCNI